VIDEPGEDYLYPQNYFLAIELPKAVEKALLSAAQVFARAPTTMKKPARKLIARRI
jgi:hypothetical protein